MFECDIFSSAENLLKEEVLPPEDVHQKGGQDHLDVAHEVPVTGEVLHQGGGHQGDEVIHQGGEVRRQEGVSSESGASLLDAPSGENHQLEGSVMYLNIRSIHEWPPFHERSF